MTANFRLQIAVLATLLCMGLFFSLKQATWNVQLEPLPALPAPPGPDISRMAPSNLEAFLLRELERVRKGEALSSGREDALKDIRKALLEHMANQPELLARLLVIIDEILLLNNELIYPDDGESRSDEDG